MSSHPTGPGCAGTDFDVDTEVDHVTMPDRVEWRAKDKQRRLDARAEFERARRQR